MTDGLEQDQFETPFETQFPAKSSLPTITQAFTVMADEGVIGDFDIQVADQGIVVRGTRANFYTREFNQRVSTAMDWATLLHTIQPEV